ncbi:fructosamine kinase family protein [Bacillus sp. SB49]|uniref:fructosamine kinase family protein n=1 Tax=Bacillus sp. SB49 TaxID=1071080 RepID=UPI000414B28E|nr:fructosamine kinase family protein [Bacillus sp. SB49]QHT48221.1 fructosamine kinase family protein [Bacillus sp. SB49]
MKELVGDILRKLDDDAPIMTIDTVSGGDINEALFVETEKQDYFFKLNQQVPSHFFRVEAEGLKRIRESRSIRVPEVYYFDEPENGEPGALAMEWIHSGKLKPASELGRQIAQMHKQTGEAYGFGEPTFVGQLDQPNDWCSAWTDYYADFRLKSQLQYGISNGRITGQRRSRLEQLIAFLDRWVPAHPQASLLHGDLWGGNWMADENGSPCLIDPSVLYGDPCFDLAMTELFGGFPSEFLHHYREVADLPPHYHDTKPIYQLFYLLVHLNIFGESYGGQVDRILKHYAG